jgi:uncharacterized integral membrane protein (TIGR00698 family)
LRAGIVLLGFRLSLSQLGSVGADAALVMVPSVALGGVAAWLIARRLGLGRELAALLAVGTAICGNSAIVACAPGIAAREEEVAAAISTVTLYGTLALVAFPLVAAALGMSSHALGLWTGSAINDTSQVVASAFSFSSAAGETATIVKLARNLFILPAVLLVPSLPSPRARRMGGRSARSDVPWFVVMFAAVAVLVSVVDVPASAVSLASWLSKVLVLAALTGIGIRATSLRLDRTFVVPVLAGTCAGLVLAVCSFVIVMWRV